MTRKKKSKGGPPHRSGFLFMILILLVLGLLFYIYRDKFSLFIMSSPTLSQVIPLEKGSEEKKERGGLFDSIVNLDKQEKNIKEKDKKEESKEEKSKEEKREQRGESKPQVVELKNREEQKKVEPPVKQLPQEIKREETIKEQKNVEALTKLEPKKTMPSKNDSLIVSRVYFSRVDQNDRLYLVKKERKVSRKLPLTETLDHLLNGPESHESDNDILSNIPGQTRLLSISIKNSVAYLNFSREFEFNRYGKESTINQLKQIVYTATEFSNINSVQFLIEGKVQTYLGGEGVLINKPLSRKDF